jgi:hypothetical protein
MSSVVRPEQTIAPLTRSRPRCSLRQLLLFALVLCFSSSHAPSPKISRPVLSTTNCIEAWLSVLGLGRNIRPLLRRDNVEKSGTAISAPSSVAIERIKPWVCRSGCLKTMPSVRQSIRTSNPIESAFATIRHRTKRSKGRCCRDPNGSARHLACQRHGYS